MEQWVPGGELGALCPLPTGFQPLDDVLGGGLRKGELMIVGGPFGVGKTIFGLQTARNVALSDEDNGAVYVCYEHDPHHLTSRLICLESAAHASEALTLRRLAEESTNQVDGAGLVSRLRQRRCYTPFLEVMESYADRLVLVRASSNHSALDEIRTWVEEAMASGPRRWLLVLDYLQKVPVGRNGHQSEIDTTTYLAQGLKELAMALGIQVIAIAASDRPGLKSKRMRLADLRGSSALQYEADVGLILNNKHNIVSREHLIYNLAQAESMRNWVVMSVEKNRAGPSAVDMEYVLDAAHFRLMPTGRFVRERLVDERVIPA